MCFQNTLIMIVLLTSRLELPFLDIIECNNTIHMCSDNGTCINTAGSYECECFDGFTGDGFYCSGK